MKEHYRTGVLKTKEKFEDIKRIIRSCSSKTDCQYNDKMKKNKWTNDDLQNTSQKS